MVIWRTWTMSGGRNFAFKIAVKSLQTETWLLLAAYRRSLSPYHCTIVTISTIVDLLRRTVLPHTYVTDLQTTDRHTGTDRSYPRLDLTVS